MEQQDRGTAGSSAPIVRYGNQYLSGVTPDMLVFKIPAVEIAADPLLTQAPVPYVFK
jgi:hypothetical protein